MQKFSRTLQALVAGTVLCASALAAIAQEYPVKAVRIMYPNTPGSTGDISVRAIAEKLVARFGQPFVVENRPGANSMLAATAVHGATPDGYTLYYGAIYPLTRTFQKNPPFDVLADFESMGGTSVSSYVIAVNTDLPAKTLAELVALAKREPGKLNFAAFNATQKIAWGMLGSHTGIDTTLIQYRGSPQMGLALITNEAQVAVDNPFAFVPHAGKVRLLAATNDVRISSLPDVPTTVELGYPNFKLFTTSSFWTRSGVPARAQERMIAAMKEIAVMPDIVARARTAGGSPLVADAAEIKRRVVEEARLYADAAKSIKYEPE